MVLLSGCLQMLIYCRLLRLEFNQRRAIDKPIGRPGICLLFSSCVDGFRKCILVKQSFHCGGEEEGDFQFLCIAIGP